jgi:hypothetical protein
MGQLQTPKQRVKFALEIVRYMIRRERRNARDGQQPKASSESGPSKAAEKTQRILDRATKAVFKKAGLNINDIEHWQLLLPWLAWAIYGRNPGHPKRWSKRKLRRLLADVMALQSKNTKLTEEACCAQLIKDNHYLDMGVTKDTLRRRLQEAKKLDSKRTK